MITHTTMDEDEWPLIEFFDPGEFNHPDWLDRTLIYAMDDLRRYVGKKFIPHCDFEFRKGWHGKGFAIDGHFENMHAYDMYEAACRFDDFNGIGFYLWWNSPGIHIDTRPHGKLKHDARWFSPKKGIYLPVTAENLRRYL